MYIHISYNNFLVIKWNFIIRRKELELKIPEMKTFYINRSHLNIDNFVLENLSSKMFYLGKQWL